MFDNLKLGFIGFGNMGQAIATGLINQGAIQGNQIFACAKNWDKLCKNTQEKQINPCKSAKEVVDNVDMVIIAVKPYMIEEVITPIKKELQEKIEEIGVGQIASISGRYYAMDRDNRWERVGKAYDAMVYGEGNKADNAVDAIKASYAADVTDEFVVPTVIDENGKISANDSVIFFNFRPDRAREITRTLVDDDFTGFERRNGRFPLYYVCMTQYDATMPNVDVAFKPASLENTFGEYIAKKGLSQLRIAETEKYAHVTFFFNGGVEAPFENEDRALINSPKVATYDLQPEMSAYLVCDEVLKRIESDKYDAIILNYANCDMVGHTGVFDAAVAAVEAVDECVGKTVDAVLAKGGIALITADHGNADKMMEDDGSPFTAHTTNLVPLIIAGAGNVLIREGGVLADLSPTMLKLMGLEQPKEMTGKSIIKD